jgi:hypothetical protein
MYSLHDQELAFWQGALGQELPEIYSAGPRKHQGSVTRGITTLSPALMLCRGPTAPKNPCMLATEFALEMVPHDSRGPDYQVDDPRRGHRRRGGGGGSVLRARLRSGAGAWEMGWTARLVPLTVDGLIYASSMAMLDSARRRVPVPALARWLVGPWHRATLAANVAHGCRRQWTGPGPSPASRCRSGRTSCFTFTG